MKNEIKHIMKELRNKNYNDNNTDKINLEINLDETLSKKINNFLLGTSNDISSNDIVNLCNKLNVLEQTSINIGSTPISLFAGIEVYYSNSGFEYYIERYSNDYETIYGSKYYLKETLLANISENESVIESSSAFLNYYKTSLEKITELNQIFKEANIELKKMKNQSMENKNTIRK